MDKTPGSRVTKSANNETTKTTTAHAELLAAVRKTTPLTHHQTINRGSTIWFQGMPAFAEPGTVALETAFNRYVVMDEKDVLAVEKQESAFLVEVNEDTNVMVRSESVVKARQDRTPPEKEPGTPGTIASVWCEGGWVIKCIWHTDANGRRYKVCWPQYDECKYMTGRNSDGAPVIIDG